MKKTLIMLAWLLSIFFVAAILPTQDSFAQTHNTPYPIIFVHGLNDNNIGCWGDLDGKFDNVLDYLNGAGLQFGDNLNICLNYNLSQTGVNNTKESDVHLFTPSPNTGDYYTINFNTHADGTRSAGAETTLISGALALSFDDALFVYNPSIFKVNDIISVDDELMQVTGYSFGSLTVNRAMFGTTLAAHGVAAGVYNISNESNQESIAKQGYALKLAIDAIKKADPTVTKVILVGHSMGGLAIREYLRNYYRNDVAKVVTIGTPHLGSNSGEVSSQFDALKNVDIKSNAIRDLDYNYDGIDQDPSPPYNNSPDDGAYLFGVEDELFLVSETNFYSWDVNADGKLDATTGLNANLVSTLPSAVSYRWIVSDWAPWGVNLQGDGVVRRLRQFPWNQYDTNNKPKIAAGDTIMTNKFHTSEPKDYFSLLRGLDEPSLPGLAYEIGPNSTTKGFITYGTNYNPQDTDLFKINLQANGLITVNITANGNSGITFVQILKADQTVVKTTSNIYQSLSTDPLQAGPYYIKIIGKATGVSYQYPYTLAVSTSAVNSSLVVSPPGTMDYYDELINQARDTIITVTNNSAASLTVSGLTLAGPNTSQFAISPPLGFALQPGASQNISVRFLPTSAGIKKAMLNIASNSTDNPMVNILLHGHGVATATKRLVVTPNGSFNFGNRQISVSSAEAFTLLDTGSTQINISAIKLIGPNANEFFLSTPGPAPFSVNSNGGKAIFVLNFLPASVGAKNAQLVITNNSDNKSPADTINLYGNGINSGSTAITGNIVAYEYWFDDNYGARVHASISPQSLAFLNANFSTPSLTIGSHLLHIRYQDQNGKWSVVQSEDFYKAPIVPSGVKKIVTYEYWFDNNYAAKVRTSVTPNQASVINNDLNAKALTTGTHTYNIRYKDNIGEWSSVETTVFNKSPIKPLGARQIVAYEYWFDNNYAAKVTASVTPILSSVIDNEIDAKSLPAGTHTYNIRYKDDIGQWSSVASTVFNKSPIAPSANRQIVAYEYWFDNNYATKVTTSVSPIQSSIINNEIDAKYLTTGTHTYNIRYKDNIGEWSSIVSSVFYKSPLAPFSTRQIVKYEYWFDNNYKAKVLVPVSPTQTAVTNSNIPTTSLSAGAHNYNVRFEDNQGQWSSVTTTGIKVLSKDASLANLTLSSGTLSPVFATPTTIYKDSVINAVTSITLTPTTSSTFATVKVNGATIASGTASGAIPLNVGPNTITAIITAQDGITTKTYTVTVIRAASNNPKLAWIRLSSGLLSPSFAAATTSYTASVSYTTASITVTPTAVYPTTTIKVNGLTVISGTASAAIPLIVGANTITLVGTAQDGVTTKTYTVTITRISNNPKLAWIRLSSGTLSPAFAAATTSYTASVGYTTTSITVTPTAVYPTTTITVNGTAVTSGTASPAIPLTVGANAITLIGTAQDGVTKMTYTLTVTRISGNPKLAWIHLSAGTLSPVFAAATTGYTASVTNATTSITVTPTAVYPTTAIKINGITVISGAASPAIYLKIGANTITLNTTAQDGVTKDTYTVTVTRATGPVPIATPQSDVENTANNLPNDGIMVHQGVSPNGDGANDFLTIDGITNYPDNKLMIMTRNGVLVFEVRGYDNSTRVFDGHSNKNGKLQQPGTYFYSLEYKAGGVNKRKTGFIVLKW
jgi:gliding motility-associated-like protein